MKKISFIALAGLAAFACAKSTVDLEVHTSPVDKDEPVEVGRTADIVLYASVDKDVETKLSASEKDGYVEFNFDENDEISTFFVSGDKKDVNVKFTYKEGKFVPDEDQRYTTLEGAMPEVYGIYPYEKDMLAVTDLTKVPVTIPQVQMYDPKQYTSNPRYPKDYCHFAAVPTTLIDEGSNAYSVDTKFYTMGSMIKFQVQNNTGAELCVRSVNIYGAPGLSGDFTANLTETPEYGNEDFILDPVEGGNQYNHVCVSFGNDGFALGNKYKMPLYAFVNAVDFDPTTEGFSMTVSTDKGTYIADFEKRKDGVDGFARNTRYTYTVTLDSGRKIDEYVARYSNDGGATWTMVKSLKHAIYEITDSKPKSNGIVELLSDENITNIAGLKSGSACYIMDNKNFTLNGNGYKLDISKRASSAFTYSKNSNPFDIELQDIEIFENPDVNQTTPLTSRFLYMNNADAKVKLGKGVVVDGVVNANANNGGGAILVSKGTLTIDGAKITNCKSTEKSGGAIYNGGTLNFVTGEISKCSTGASGGAIYNYGGTTNIYCGKITDCSALSSGSAIFATGTVNVIGGEISCNEGTTGAIYGNSYTTEITIGREDDPTSCPIINNTTGRGVYSYGITKIYGGKFTTYGVSAYSLSGSNGNASMDIYGGEFESINTNSVCVAKSDKYTSNTEISGGRFKCNDKVSVVYGDAEIQVSGGYFSKEVKTDYLKKADEAAGTREYKNYPNDEYEGYPYKVEEQHAAIFVNGSERELKATIEDAIDAANASGVGACKIILTEDCTIGSASKNVTNGNGVTLDLNGKTLTQNGSKRLGLSGSGHLIIIDGDSNNKGGVVKQAESVTSGFTFSISSGTLEIKGGTIKQPDNEGTATINVYGAELTVSDNAIILGNKKAALQLASGTVNINGGEVSSTAIYALQMTGGTVNINGGEISSTANYALALQGGTVNINGGEISSTVAHAIYMSNSTGNLNATVKGGKIIATAASKYSVYVKELTENSKFTINGGDFRSNYRCLFSATEKGSIEISPVDDVTVPHFYSYDSNGTADSTVKLFSRTTGCVLPVCSCGYYGCASEKAKWELYSYRLAEGNTLYGYKSTPHKNDGLEYWRYIGPKK